jgi:hypothetical protein
MPPAYMVGGIRLSDIIVGLMLTIALALSFQILLTIVTLRTARPLPRWLRRCCRRVGIYCAGPYRRFRDGSHPVDLDHSWRSSFPKRHRQGGR